LASGLPPHYTILAIGNLPGSYSEVVTAINDAGQVVGRALMLPNGNSSHGFVWSQAAGFTDLYPIAGTTGINNAGQIIGCLDVSPSTGCVGGSPVLYSVGGITGIPFTPNGFALGINNGGQVVGSEYGQVVGFQVVPSVPVIYSAGTVTQLPICNNCASQAITINDNAQIAGNIGYTNSPCFFYSGGVTTTLACAYVTGINNSAQVVGSGFNAHGVLWTPTGGFIDLGVLSGSSTSVASGINKNGQVVGTSSCSGAFIWTQTSGMISLNALIEDSAWFLEQASAINDNGQIVGIGTHNGQRIPFLLTPMP
jgi:probable HAF family extracellular repeat protein